MKNILYLATANRHKTRELSDMLVGKGFEARDLSGFADYVPPEEKGATFLENARIKALALKAYLARREPYVPAYVLADDSGLECDALDGAPGVRSARFAGTNATDRDNNLKLVAILKDVPETRRTARFVCALVLIAPAGTETNVMGTCEGKILLEPKGSGGFGYDPYFRLEEFGKTMAELTPEEKNRVSHRGKALRKLLLTPPLSA